MLSDHNGIKLKIYNRKATGKAPNTGKGNTTLLNNPWIKEELSGEILIYLELHENKNATY